MKVIVSGSRSIISYDLVAKVLDEYVNSITMLVSGDAQGVDKLSQRWADENDIQVKLFPANWDKYGKSAGMIRNKEMAEYADYLIAIWDGKSKGTKGMIDIMLHLNKGHAVYIIKPENEIT